jgi:hypothetical protein
MRFLIRVLGRVMEKGVLDMVLALMLRRVLDMVLALMLRRVLEKVLGVLALMFGKSEPCSCAGFFASDVSCLSESKM